MRHSIAGITGHNIDVVVIEGLRPIYAIPSIVSITCRTTGTRFLSRLVPEKLIAYSHKTMEEGLKKYQATAAKPAKVGPSLPIASYTGTHADAWYGKIEIGQANGKLTIDFKSTPRMSGALEHWQYDTFITRFDDKAIEPAYVTFNLDAEGKIDRITMKPVSPLADFSWDYQDLLFKPAKAAK